MQATVPCLLGSSCQVGLHPTLLPYSPGAGAGCTSVVMEHPVTYMLSKSDQYRFVPMYRYKHIMSTTPHELSPAPNKLGEEAVIPQNAPHRIGG